MKKINYSRVFTQELRKKGVMGIFADNASDELLSLLYSKKDTWNVVTNEETTSERVRQLALEIEREGEGGILEALKITDKIWITIEEA